MKYILLALAALALLFGCAGNTGVTQAQYTALSASCAQQNETMQSQLNTAQTELVNAQGSLSDCVSEKQADDRLISSKDDEIAVLTNESDVLADARQEAALVNEYGNLTEYYNDTYGAGMVPNTAKVDRIDALVAQLNDTSLSALWGNIRNCQTLLGCQDAESAFQAGISANVAILNAKVEAIVAG